VRSSVDIDETGEVSTFAASHVPSKNSKNYSKKAVASNLDNQTVVMPGHQRTTFKRRPSTSMDVCKADGVE